MAAGLPRHCQPGEAIHGRQNDASMAPSGFRPAENEGEAVLCERAQQPRTGGLRPWSRRQARRSISSQARNCRSLLMQMRTSLMRDLLQVTATAALERPGLTLTKASSMSAGEIVFGSDNSMNSGGIFTAARALRTVSK